MYPPFGRSPNLFLFQTATCRLILRYAYRAKSKLKIMQNEDGGMQNTRTRLFHFEQMGIHPKCARALRLGARPIKSDLKGGRKTESFWVGLAKSEKQSISKRNKASPTTPSLKPENIGKDRINMCPLTYLIQICCFCLF